jgi:hypothetical protein
MIVFFPRWFIELESMQKDDFKKVDNAVKPSFQYETEELFSFTCLPFQRFLLNFNFSFVPLGLGECDNVTHFVCLIYSVKTKIIANKNFASPKGKLRCNKQKINFFAFEGLLQSSLYNSKIVKNCRPLYFLTT